MTGLITSVPMWPKPIVWTSGSARMMSSFEMTPFAPGRLSTMTCRPRLADIFGAVWRATRSVAPPGGKPTIMRTGLPGAHSAASAAEAVNAAVAAAATAAAVRCTICSFDAFTSVAPLLRFRARCLDDLGPFHRLGPDVLAECFRRARRRVQTLLEQNLLDVRHRQH